VVGAGGREHALAVALSRTDEVVVTPGNPGMAAGLAGGGLALSCTGAPAEEVDADLYVIGPEVPLVGGLADRLRAGGRLVFGPGADGARLEGSKAWMKEVLVDAGVPTAAHATFDAVEPALAYLASLGGGPYVVKTDGLAAGKGVRVTESLAEAADDVAAKLSGAAFGAAGRRVVIEEGLTGEELSVMAVCDGRRAVALAAARDYKRVGDGDTGPNTGGMGACSPVPGAGPVMVDEVVERIVLPTLAALRGRGVDYRGVLYAGLMLTATGPKVLEFNVRFGDPESQVLFPRWRGEVAGVLAAAAGGRLDRLGPGDTPSFDRAAVCVVLAAPGYPSSPVTGGLIEGAEAAAQMERVDVFAAGVGLDGSGRLVTAGGRVFGVTAVAADLGAARARAYRAAECISWPGMLVRQDIGVVPAARATGPEGEER
jgi:phosphoribosylamine--glycine ligase